MDFVIRGPGRSLQSSYKTGIRLLLVVFAVTAQLSSLSVRAQDNTGPIRLARFSYLSGSVTWHYGDDASWENAARNMPIREGAQIWTGDTSRAEIQFDDGTRLRLESNTLVTLQTLYSDDKGEYTELTLNNGSVHMHLKTRYSVYQINTPYASLKAAGPSRFGVNVEANCVFKQFFGSSTIEGNGGSVTLQQGQALFPRDANSPFQVVSLPPPDDWDTWNSTRDARIDNPDRNPYLPPDIALDCDDLEKHGSWHHDRRYGWVWLPQVTTSDWRPYGAGSWTWVTPFGWTWVSADTWGWAPYHYGTWIHAEYGWAWVPGPANQYWCPGVVSFHQVNGGIAWVPLCPNEVRYPTTLSLSFRSGSWSMFFSIGGAAVYYPGAGNYCEPRPWTSAYINGAQYSRSFTNVSINTASMPGSSFVPANARFGGGTYVNSQEFGGRGTYRAIAANHASMIASGRVIGAPPVGQRPVMGPLGVRPTKASLTPDRSFTSRPSIPSGMSARAVFRAPLPKSVPQTQIAQSGQRLLALNANRVRLVGIKRDGSNFTTPLRTSGAGALSRGGSTTTSGAGNLSRTTRGNNPESIPPVKTTSPGLSASLTATDTAPPRTPAVDRTQPPVQRDNPNPPMQRTPSYTHPPAINPPSGGGSSRGGGGGGGSTKTGRKQ